MKKSLMLLSALGMSINAHATLMLCEGAGCEIQGAGIENVLLPDVGDTGTEIIGQTNLTFVDVRFAGNGETLEVLGGGQARLGAVDGILDMITVDTVDDALGFEHVVFNVDVAVDTTVDIYAYDNFGTLFDFGTLAADGQGQNWFTIGSDDIQYIDSFTIEGDGIVAMTDIQQIRVDPDLLPGDPDPVDVMSPDSMALLALGLCGLFSARIRKS